MLVEGQSWEVAEGLWEGVFSYFSPPLSRTLFCLPTLPQCLLPASIHESLSHSGKFTHGVGELMVSGWSWPAC